MVVVTGFGGGRGSNRGRLGHVDSDDRSARRFNSSSSSFSSFFSTF
jgi:hypothetical protein